MFSKIKQWWQGRKEQTAKEDLADRIVRFVNVIHDDEWFEALKRTTEEGEVDVFSTGRGMFQALYVHPFIFLKSISYPIGGVEKTVWAGFVIDNDKYDRSVAKSIFSGKKCHEGKIGSHGSSLLMTPEKQELSNSWTKKQKKSKVSYKKSGKREKTLSGRRERRSNKNCKNIPNRETERSLTRKDGTSLCSKI